MFVQTRLFGTPVVGPNTVFRSNTVIGLNPVNGPNTVFRFNPVVRLNPVNGPNTVVRTKPVGRAGWCDWQRD